MIQTITDHTDPDSVSSPLWMIHKYPSLDENGAAVHGNVHQSGSAAPAAASSAAKTLLVI